MNNLPTLIFLKIKIGSNINMEPELISDKLTKVFRTVFNDDTINLNNDITAKDIGSWDSLSHMLMITEVENTFSIKFKLREINKLKNVGTLIELIKSKINFN